jgi:hypothetical protein
MVRRVEMDFRLFLGGLVSLPTVVWVVALILSIVLIGRGASSAKRFLIIGSSLMLVSTVVRATGDPIANYAFRHGSSPGTAISIISNASLLISIPGIICLFYAVWKKFDESTGMVAENRKKDNASSRVSN